MRRFLLAVLLVCAGSCKSGTKPGPLGIPLANDGVTYAGAAVVDITPEITETFTDLNNNHLFDGCLDNPAGGTEACKEPFNDTNGNGRFDAVFIGGFSPLRPALSVHDPITARAFVIAQDGQYIAFVALDLVGLGTPRIHEARDRLVKDGFNGDRLIVSSTHNHQGPDTMGLWGDPYDFSNPTSGANPAYQERVARAIEQAVRDASQAMKPVKLRVGSVRMQDRDPYFNGSMFGGKNPRPHMHGMINDIRDPILASDQLLVLQGMGADGKAVFTWTNWSGHPEVRGGDNNALSADWPGVSRAVLEKRFGGIAIHQPESLGGMQSALGGEIPLVREDGTHVYEEGLDEQGQKKPVWAAQDSWEFVTSHGWHIAEAAMAALEKGEEMSATPIRVEVENFTVPVTNVAYNLLGPSGIFELGLEDAITDETRCPEKAGSISLGCMETRTFRIQVGPIGLVTMPGEIFPELAWGLPTEDPKWVEETASLAKRGPQSRYFPQHEASCNDVTFEQCSSEEKVGECNCLRLHAVPYKLSPNPELNVGVLSRLDTKYRAAMSMTDNYFSYAVPEPDFHRGVSLLSDNDGDHYEDTVSVSFVFATRVQEAQARIAKRW